MTPDSKTASASAVKGSEIKRALKLMEDALWLHEQTCSEDDYVLVLETSVNEVIKILRKAVKQPTP